MAISFEVDLTLDDVEIVEKFLEQAITFSKLIVREPSDTGTWFGVRVQFVKGQIGSIRETADAVAAKASKELEHFKQAAGNDGFSEMLERAGLSGKELRTKISVLNQWATHFKDEAKSSIKALGKVLDNVISILGSLASEIPGFEFFKEMYELIKNAIEVIHHHKTNGA